MLVALIGHEMQRDREPGLKATAQVYVRREGLRLAAGATQRIRLVEAAAGLDVDDSDGEAKPKTQRFSAGEENAAVAAKLLGGTSSRGSGRQSQLTFSRVGSAVSSASGGKAARRRLNEKSAAAPPTVHQEFLCKKESLLEEVTLLSKAIMVPKKGTKHLVDAISAKIAEGRLADQLGRWDGAAVAKELQEAVDNIAAFCEALSTIWEGSLTAHEEKVAKLVQAMAEANTNATTYITDATTVWDRFAASRRISSQSGSHQIRALGGRLEKNGLKAFPQMAKSIATLVLQGPQLDLVDSLDFGKICLLRCTAADAKALLGIRNSYTHDEPAFVAAVTREITKLKIVNALTKVEMKTSEVELKVQGQTHTVHCGQRNKTLECMFHDLVFGPGPFPSPLVFSVFENFMYIYFYMYMYMQK